MKSRKVFWIVALIAALLVGAVALRILQSQRAQKTAAATPKAVAVLELPQADVVTAQRQDLRSGVDISGTVRASRTAFVKAKVASEVRQIAVREGDTVRQGQVLVQQDTSEFDWRVRQADQQAQAARAQVDIAQRALANNKALVAQGFISATALESSASNEAGAQANLQAAMAGVELARKALADATLTAPISGVVSQRLVQAGERVGVDARILEIVDLSALEIEAALTPGEVARLRVGQGARVAVDGLPGDIGARVARISPSAQAGSRTVSAYLALEPHPALRHGLFARGRIDLEQSTVLALPVSAVRKDRADPYVLLLDGERIRAQRITIGPAATAADGSEWVPITQGLTDGSRVLAGTVAAVADGTAWKPAVAAPAAPAAPASR
jgi:membrane fusion protein, multidrug efflux system